jgi:hypothetical protein
MRNEWGAMSLKKDFWYALPHPPIPIPLFKYIGVQNEKWY